MKEQTGPCNPLDEKEAEIARLRKRIELLEDAAKAYLDNSTPANALKLDDVLKAGKQ